MGLFISLFTHTHTHTKEEVVAPNIYDQQAPILCTAQRIDAADAGSKQTFLGIARSFGLSAFACTHA